MIYRKTHSNLQLHGVQRGKGNFVFGHIDLVGRKKLKVGSNCSFNHRAYINAFNGITIGDDVTLSAGSKVISTGIDYLEWASGNKGHLMEQSIRIGDHVWIGANAQILGGVTISGRYVVVAAGAVVTENILDDRVVVAGCPAKIIKHF